MDLDSVRKQGHLLNDLRSLGLDVFAIIETNISGKYALASIFEDYTIFSSCDLPGASVGVAVLTP